MTRYVSSFDDSTGRLKRLTKAYQAASPYNSNIDAFYFQTPTFFSSSLAADLNTSDAVVYIQDNASNNHLVICSNGDSMAKQPVITFTRKRLIGSVQYGDALGKINWNLTYSIGFASNVSEISCIYTGDGTTTKTKLLFKTGTRYGFCVTDTQGIGLYKPNNTNGLHDLSINAHATSATWSWIYPINAGTNGQVLATDGSGNTSWIDGPAHNALSGRSASDCHPTSAITNFTSDVNSLISNYFSNLTDYSFDADATGTTTFDLGFSLVGRIIFVYENGVIKRAGATYDYQVIGTQIVFNYTVKSSWVNVTISAVGVNEYSFDAGNGGQTTFDTTVNLTGKRVVVYENGALKRQGVTYDWISSGTIVTFNYSVKNAWVLVIVYT